MRPESLVNDNFKLDPAPGLGYGKGNINLDDRPVLHFEDGSSASIGAKAFNLGTEMVTFEDGSSGIRLRTYRDPNIPGETVLLPTVRRGLKRHMTDEETIDWYQKTGQYLGKFKTEGEANAYSQQLRADVERQRRKLTDVYKNLSPQSTPAVLPRSEWLPKLVNKVGYKLLDYASNGKVYDVPRQETWRQGDAKRFKNNKILQALDDAKEQVKGYVKREIAKPLGYDMTTWGGSQTNEALANKAEDKKDLTKRTALPLTEYGKKIFDKLGVYRPTDYYDYLKLGVPRSYAHISQAQFNPEIPKNTPGFKVLPKTQLRDDSFKTISVSPSAGDDPNDHPNNTMLHELAHYAAQDMMQNSPQQFEFFARDMHRARQEYPDFGGYLNMREQGYVENGHNRHDIYREWMPFATEYLLLVASGELGPMGFPKQVARHLNFVEIPKGLQVTTRELDFLDAWDEVANEAEWENGPDHPLHFYDYRRAYGAGELKRDESGHFSSKYKRLGHPNLIVDGIDTRTGKLATPELMKANREENERVQRTMELDQRGLYTDQGNRPQE